MPFADSSRLRLLEAFVRSGRRLGRPQHSAAHLEVGCRGEEDAYFYLRRNGYIIVARDWRSGKVPGDLDLIGWDDSTLCFIEVKTRSGRGMAAPEVAVGPEKIHRLRRVARQYLRTLPSPPAETRFDILSVYPGEERSGGFELFRGAFGWY